MPVLRDFSHGVQSFESRAILPERETNPYTSAKAFVFFSNGLDVPLLFTDFGILGHVFDGCKVVVVACVDLGVESGDEGGRDRAQIVEFHVLEEGVPRELAEICVADTRMRYQSEIRVYPSASVHK